MARVRFTPHLVRFFPDLRECEVDAVSVRDAVRELDRRFPGLAAYLVDERGALRKHVVIFVDERALIDREALGDPLGPASSVYVFQALSGG
ncbi:MAG: MoaD/ThiS family protein [Planctomycetes bacterium]|nr:MoaD/ThiS family protein [Planctomycetota bacterium]